MRFDHRLPDQKFRQLRIELRLEDMQGIHPLLKQAGGDDHVGVHGPIGDAQPARQYPSPALRLAAGILIADHHGRVHFCQQRFQGIFRRPAHDKSDLPLLQIFFDIRQALVQKGVVAPVGVGKIGDGGEVGQDRQIEGVANFDGNVERGIVERSFRSLHPVDDAFCIGRQGAAAPDKNSGVFGDLAQRFR